MTCVHHIKHAYTTKKQALTMASLGKKGYKGHPIVLRVYKCPVCHYWHLTKREVE